MSHEPDIPVNSIPGFGEMLNIDSIEPLGETQNSFVVHFIKMG